jgi:hypothetical protein
MNYRELGKTGVKVSEISFGCWTMGGLNGVNGTPNGWADENEDEITAGIKAAIDAGVNHFDDADVYGNGRAERMLARVFDKLGVKSTDVVIATKVGPIFPAGGMRMSGAFRHRCHRSLINLKREYIDLYYSITATSAKAIHLPRRRDNGQAREGRESPHPRARALWRTISRTVPVVKPSVLQLGARAGRPIRPPRLTRLSESAGEAWHDLCRVQPTGAVGCSTV